MIFEQTNQKKIVVLKSLKKRLEADIAEQLKKEIEEPVHNGSRLLIIDISDVDFIDSSGLGAIISGFKLLGDEGKIVISGAKEGVKGIFQITRMDKLFWMFENLNDAVEALSALKFTGK